MSENLDAITREVPDGRAERSGPEEKRLQGHWLLAKMGKKVLRPGGMELTKKLIEAANPSANDRIVEFGPGVGRTALVLLLTHPRSYIGIDPNSEVTPQLKKVLDAHKQAKLVVANAKQTTLDNESCDLVFGEAMLTMHSAEEKLEIAREAARILTPGGRYAIHELGFRPDDCPPEVKDTVSRALSRTIKVGARPLTMVDWREVLENAGLEVEFTAMNDMALLEPKRIFADEGIFGALRFAFNVARNRAARERIFAMRKVFRANRNNLCGVALVGRKPLSRGETLRGDND